MRVSKRERVRTMSVKRAMATTQATATGALLALYNHEPCLVESPWLFPSNGCRSPESDCGTEAIMDLTEDVKKRTGVLL